MPSTLAVAERIAANAPLTVRQAKNAAQLGMHMNLRDALFFAVAAYGALVRTERVLLPSTKGARRISKAGERIAAASAVLLST